ncbi:MAG TPA: hypothetical protein VE152_08470, partial [Acidimicrobiales bacterium]|nr:hypothetical protein [Acidimicrobiales bacterium]
DRIAPCLGCGVVVVDLLDEVRISCDAVVRTAAHVRIDRDHLPRYAAALVASLQAAGHQVDARTVDNWLWSDGQQPRYKARPRHRTRTVWY